MTPDLKRLCDAAGNVELDMYPDYLRDEEAEKVVRAVLTALRAPAADTLAAASVDFLRDVTDPWDCMPAQMDEAFGLPTEGAEVWAPAEERIRPRVQRSFAAMIDAILGEPATA